MLVLIENDVIIGSEIQKWFTDHGYHTYRYTTLAQAKLFLARNHDTIKCIVLDRGLPDGEGVSLLDWIHNTLHTHIPTIMFTSRTQIDDILEGFNVGVDDYVSKSCDIRELNARVKRLITPPIHGHTNFISGTFRCDLKAKKAWVGDIECHLSATERHALEIFCHHRGNIVPRSTLIDTLWGGNAWDAENNLDVLIAGLRKKIGKQTIITVKGIGYRIGGNNGHHQKHNQPQT